ncbi:Imm57 family immunity protein [Paraburkholderia bannensis]|uniref:Imm57 family immunity protein n=1 Tax=Paraburkholderia bannensis TaxID=765414 RepID=UPI0012EC7F7F|nr:Imm57 family immunity protein [Paraburkholderia bannensis]
MNYLRIATRLIICILFFLNSLISFAKENGVLNRDEREIRMAESALFWSRVATVSDYGQRACESNQFACSDDRADLGLALIGAKKSIASIHALVSVSRFRMDGALSENYVCYILSKGRVVLSELKSMKAIDAKKECAAEFNSGVENNQHLFDGVSINQVCNSVKEISILRAELIAAIKSHQRCGDGDF